MPAPLVKPKPESRRTLLERANTQHRGTTENRTKIVQTNATSATHARTLSRSTEPDSSKSKSLHIRSSSVNGGRNDTKSSTRTSSANGSRPGSSASTHAEEGTNATRRVRRAAWDTKGRLEDMEEAYKVLKDEVVAVRTSAFAEKSTISTELQDEQRRVAELTIRLQSLQSQFDLANEKIGHLQGERHIAQMEHEQAIHRSKMEIESIQVSSMRNESHIRSIVCDRERELDNTRRSADEMKQHLEAQIASRDESLRISEKVLEDLKCQFDREHKRCETLRAQLAEESTGAMSLKQFIDSLNQKIKLQEEEKQELLHLVQRKDEQVEISLREQEKLNEKLIAEETQRRILHNQIQELKGNIRVFCRVRPNLQSDASEAASIKFMENDNELEVIGTGAEMSLSGKEDKSYSFNFDKVSYTGR